MERSTNFNLENRPEKEKPNAFFETSGFLQPFSPLPLDTAVHRCAAAN